MFLQSIIRCDLLKKIAGILIAAVLILTFFCRLIGTGTRRAIEALSEESRKSFHKTVILDAGHGGEDGGAVGVDGSLEKDINLAIANAASAFLTLFGIAHISVRTTDKSVCDEGLKTVRERKRSDILNRDALVRSTENSLLVSIHQNHYSDARYSGAQMFYSSNKAWKTFKGCSRTMREKTKRREQISICYIMPKRRQFLWNAGLFQTGMK